MILTISCYGKRERFDLDQVTFQRLVGTHKIWPTALDPHIIADSPECATLAVYSAESLESVRHWAQIFSGKAVTGRARHEILM
jgi:hypothetical protein